MKLKILYQIFMWSKFAFYGLIMQCLFFSLLLASETKAQEARNISEAYLEINFINEPLLNVFKTLESTTEYKFAYDKKDIDRSIRFSGEYKSTSVATILKDISNRSKLSFKQINNSIVIKKEPVKESGTSKFFRTEIRDLFVKGRVTSMEDNQPIPGVNIIVKGTTIGTTTGMDGEYSLNVTDENVILVFSFIGYSSEEVAVNGRAVIDVAMISDIKQLSEVVVVGYGTQKKVNLTGSVSSVSSERIESRPITQASQALAGLSSGVTVIQGAGRPGNDAASIRIRGTGTFSGAGNDPLVLIDGLAASMNDVDPNNIKSISVLKDAASASIYGTRAANGVILIETKRGQQGKLQVGYDNYVGWQKVTELPDFLESWEYAELLNEANVNQGRAKTYSDEEIAKFKSGSDPDNYPNVPHLKNLLTSGSGFQTYHNIRLTGGDANNSYLFSMGYLHQDGIVAENNYDKYNFQLNFDNQLGKNLNLKTNLSGYSSDTDEPRHYEGDMMHMIAFAVREGPIYAGKKSDGTYGYQDNYSPEAWMNSESFTHRKNKYFLGGAELSWEPFKNFTLSGKAGYKYYDYTDNSYVSDFTFNANKTVGPSSLSVSSGENSLVTLQSLARYTKTINQHNFNVLAGFSQEAYREDWISASRDDFPSNLLYELNAGSSSNMQSYGSGAEWGLRSYFGRVNYSFNEKYLFEANARYDGTSRFPEKGRWGIFPSVSAGWRISEESFIKNNLTWIDNLKVRASWGKLGNQNVGNYPYQNVLSLGQNYSFGGTLSSGARLTTLANSEITWETTQVTDIGFDLTIFKGKLGMVFDYFNKTTSDILYAVSVSDVLGLSPSEVNAGEVNNKGFEVLLDYQTSIGDLNLGVSPNFSYVKNRITKLANTEEDIATGRFVGYPINAIYGYVADGLFIDQDDVDDYPTQPYAAEPGFIRYKDISGPNGVPDGKVDATHDRKLIGSSFPKFSYGATITADYKGFDISILLHGLGGYERRMGSYQAYAFYNGGQIQRWQAENRWTAENPDRNAKYIKLTSLNMGSGTIQEASTYWLRDASFIRLKNLQIGYSIQEGTLEKLNINKIRIFFSGQNLFSLNHFYEGWDPEMDQGTGDNTPFYPITSVYTFGVNVKF